MKYLFLLFMAPSLFGMHVIDIPQAKLLKARIVLQHAGYDENDTKVKALMNAFAKMKDRRLIEAVPLRSDSPQYKAGFLRDLWTSYRKTSKTVADNNLGAADMKSLCLQQQRNAQELVDASLDLFADQQNYEALLQRRQKYIILAISGCISLVTVITTGLSAYWGTQCD